MTIISWIYAVLGNFSRYSISTAEGWSYCIDTWVKGYLTVLPGGGGDDRYDRITFKEDIDNFQKIQKTYLMIILINVCSPLIVNVTHKKLL